MSKAFKIYSTIFFVFNLLLTMLIGQTTGKVSGKITDSQSGNPIIGANVIIMDTYLGASTDSDGSYYILNIPPGKYDILISYIGYKETKFENVEISVNRTTTLSSSIEQSSLVGDAVIVKKSKTSVKKDQTGTVKNISSEILDVLPVENVNSVINMQAGVVANHFRGGRQTEVTYLVDGVGVDDSFGKQSTTVEVDPSSIKELEVITGTFNAEYGKAMSGVINQITKEGSNKLTGSVAYDYSNYLSDNSNIFIGIDNFSINSNNDIKFSLGGPVISDKFFFFFNFRAQERQNHLNGYHYFNPSNVSNFTSEDTTSWYSEHTGANVFNTYCSDANGNQVFNSDGEIVTSAEECENYGLCEVIMQTCNDLDGNEVGIGDLSCESVVFDEIMILQQDNSLSSQLAYISVDQCASYSNENQSKDDIGSIRFVNSIYRSVNEKLLSMNRESKKNFLGKLTFKPFSKLKLNLLYSNNDNSWNQYNHAYKYNPYGLPTMQKKSELLSFQSNLMLSNAMFLDFKYSKQTDNYMSSVYETIVSDNLSTTAIDGYVDERYDVFINGFSSGGMSREFTNNIQKKDNLKIDYVWQFNNIHSLKVGYDQVNYDGDVGQYTIVDTVDYDSEYSPVILMNTNSPFSDEYKIKSKEYSIYVQDKMEFDVMVINAGFRYDQFDPQRTIPTDYQNPTNEINNTNQSEFVYAKKKKQISPRLGIAYQLGEEAVMHFSYGHFFQMPPLYSLFQNYDRIIPVNDFGTILGNPDLEAEKTVQYEIGIWQKLNSLIGVDLNLYYRDIYNLLSTKIITTYDDVKYGLYTNKDYGNVRGLEAKVDMVINDFTLLANYTLQYTKGNSDSPVQSFNNAGDNKDPVSVLIPMSWDQRNTFNISLLYNIDNYGISLTSYYNSGTAYSYEPISINPLSLINLLPNNAYKPSNFSTDVTTYINFKFFDKINCRVNFSIYNLFDRLNEFGVNPQTGNATTAILSDAEINSFKSNFNTIEDSYINPINFASPRQFKLGLKVLF